MAERVRRRVLVSGRVQGVAFRASTAGEARAGGVAGWVRNLADGRVEAVFEGDAAVVATLVAWCRVGPRGAHVLDVEHHEEVPEGLSDFRIR